MGDDGPVFRPERLPGETDAMYAARCRRLEKERVRLPGESDERYRLRMARREAERSSRQERREKRRLAEGKEGRQHGGRPPRVAAQPSRGVNSNQHSDAKKASRATLSKAPTDKVSVSARDPLDSDSNTQSANNVINLSDRLSGRSKRPNTIDLLADPARIMPDQETLSENPVQDSSGGFGGSLLGHSEGFKTLRNSGKEYEFPSFKHERAKAVEWLSGLVYEEQRGYKIPNSFGDYMRSVVHRILEELTRKISQHTMDHDFARSITRAVRTEVYDFMTECIEPEPPKQTRPVFAWREDEPVPPETLSAYDDKTFLVRGYALGLVDLAIYEPCHPSWWQTPELAEIAALERIYARALELRAGDADRAFELYMAAASMYSTLGEFQPRSPTHFEKIVALDAVYDRGPVQAWTRERVYLRWLSCMGLPFELGSPSDRPVEVPPGFARTEALGFPGRYLARTDEDYDKIAALAAASVAADAAKVTP